MLTLDEIKKAVHDSSELSKQGENVEAMKLLDERINQAVKSHYSRAMQILCRHASVIAEHSGHLQEAKRYRKMLAEVERESR